MDFPDDWPPEGRLIEEARDRLGISQNEAAARADMSGTRWRQIVKGEAGALTSPRGVATLARMASVVRATVDQFASIGREDVAEAIRKISPELDEKLEWQRPVSPSDDELDEMIAAARVERDHGNPELYNALMGVWRLRHPEQRETTQPDATRSQTDKTA